MKKVKMFFLMLLFLVFAPSQVGAKYSLAAKNIPVNRKKGHLGTRADGLDIVRELRQDKRGRELPIILVTARTTEIDKVKGLDIGADDYLTKPFGIMELISRVKALLRRTSREQGIRVLEIGSVCMDDEKHRVTAAGAECELTFKEYELLKLLMTNAGIVTSREEILEKVWGTNFEGESRTLDMHIKTLRQKLGETGSLIKTVRNVGYIFSA